MCEQFQYAQIHIFVNSILATINNTSHCVCGSASDKPISIPVCKFEERYVSFVGECLRKQCLICEGLRHTMAQGTAQDHGEQRGDGPN